MNMYTMPGVADMSMVWMGSTTGNDMSLGLMQQDPSEMLLDHDGGSYYASSHHSASNHSMDDMSNHMHNSPMTMDGLDMITMDSNGSSCEDDKQQVYMITTATQTIPSYNRKIKPVKHPGLVLKTPIAYHSNTDPSVIPIHKDGIAVCEKCGAIGVKHAFYTRERRFCSMACARGFSAMDESNGLNSSTSCSSSTQTMDSQYAEHKFKMEFVDDLDGLSFDSALPQIPKQEEMQPIEENLSMIRRRTASIANTYDWDHDLSLPTFEAAPVTCFPTAPMADIWHNIMVGMKVEVENTDCDNFSDTFPDSFWVATVMKIVGYKALLRYEGFGSNVAKDFWVSLCSNQVHPVGWCATIGKPLIPPKSIESKYSDWKDFLKRRLTGARTLPSNFGYKVNEALKSRFTCGLNLEVVDKNRISQVKVAKIQKIVGKRLNVKYYDMSWDDPGFWCHEDSSLLHPVGWAHRVGHHIVAPPGYNERISDGYYDEEDATNDLFNQIQVGSVERCCDFHIGMKLEAIDPLNLSSICAATVMDVLNCGYIMIRIDTYDADATGADWFCYHRSSPCIFPIGFCETHSIPLTPPKGYDADTFSWPTYLALTKNVPVPKTILSDFVPSRGFKQNMKIEAADLMDPRLVCVATIARVVGRLLKVHFDGWEEEYDQWLDCDSPDIYPVGWCCSVGHKLEGPRNPGRTGQKTLTPSKNIKRKGRKKKTKESPPSRNSSSNRAPTKKDDLVKKVLETHEDFDNDESSHHPEPETAVEPAGPDQSMPISAEPPPPQERKVTSYISTTSNSTKFIPRLVDSSGGVSESGELCPNEWNIFDVAQFLRVNDCANYCDLFNKHKIDGKVLLNLTKEDILEYTGGKVGPSLKIYDLIQQLKSKVNHQSRHLKAANIKKVMS